MASVIVSNVLEIVDELEEEFPASSLLDSFNNAKGDMLKLVETLLRIQSVLTNAEQREIMDKPVRLWLRELKVAAYNAEDFLQDCKLQLLEQSKAVEIPTHPNAQGEVDELIGGNQREERLDKIEHSVSELSLVDCSIKNRIRKVNEALHQVANKIDTLGLNVRGSNDTIKLMSPIALGSHVTKSVIFGREDDKERIVEFLLSATNTRRNLSVVSIVGAEGVGKTTLAELIYNDPRVREHFEPRGWVCVSPDFNLMRITNELMKSLSKCLLDYGTLSPLQEHLQQNLVGKRFLLVFDDVWNDDKDLWEVLRVPFTVGLEGSTAIITTQKESVAAAMQTVLPYNLGCLSEEDCWLLIRQHAFDSRASAEKPSIVRIAKKLVEKCKRLPLSVKLLGGLLGLNGDVEKWKDILESNLWECDEVDSEILPALILSYFHLPSHLKQCFAYCSLYPKGFLFEKDRLIRLWLAQGFIKPEGKKRWEDIGGEYFDELLRRSFFQSYHSDSNKQTYAIHNLIHDLAEFVSNGEIYRVEDSNLWSVPTEARHSSLVLGDFMSKVRCQFYEEHKDMRTFLVDNRLLDSLFENISWGENNVSLHISNSMFYYLKYLRTLDLSGSDIKSLPDSIGSLKHLHFLGLNRTKLQKLPESVCNLYHLQTLELQESIYLQNLPISTKNLINLRHLYLPNHVHFAFMPVGIGKLTNLQTLSAFCVGPEIEHCGISELKNLVHLQGKLCISGLSNIVNVEDAKGANLKSKGYIEKLSLVWNHGGAAYLEEEMGKGDGEEQDDCFWCSEIAEKVEEAPLHAELADNNWVEVDGCKVNECAQFSSGKSGNEDEQWIQSFNLFEEVKSEDTQKESSFSDTIKKKVVEDELASMEDDNWNDSICLFEEKFEQKITQEETCSCKTVDKKEMKDERVSYLASLEDNLQIYISNSKNDGSDNESPKRKSALPTKVVGELDASILESLEAHTNLKELVIRFYNGIQFPKWIGDSSFSNLVTITLKDCIRCKILPTLGQLPSLKYLDMQDFHHVERIGREFCYHGNMNSGRAFPSLDVLRCRTFHIMEDWCGAEDGAFPRLSQLDLDLCFHLTSLTCRFPFLTKLVIGVCHKLMVLPTLPSLTHLELHCCSEDIWSSLHQDLLNKLQVLSISGFENFASLPLHQLSSLKEFEISTCQVHARNNSPLGLNKLLSLERLKVNYCPNLWIAHQEELPLTLKVLNISSGSPVLATWCRSYARSKLQHVSQIIIDNKDFHPTEEERVNVDQIHQGQNDTDEPFERNL